MNIFSTTLEIKEMYDEDMNPLDVARHPRQIIKIPMDKKVEKWDLIRIKKSWQNKQSVVSFCRSKKLWGE